MAKVTDRRSSKPEPQPERRPVSQAERTIFFTFVAAIGLSIVAFLAIIIASATGMHDPAAYRGGLWPTVIVLLQFGPPIAILMLVTLLVINIVRRRRESKDANQ